MKDTVALDEYERIQEALLSVIKDNKTGDHEKVIQNHKIEKDKVENTNDPINIEDALSRPDRDLWIDAMIEEVNSLKVNDTWELVKKPEGREVIDTK